MKIPGALIFLIILTTSQVCHAQPSKFEASIGAQTLEIIKKTQGIYENPRLYRNWVSYEVLEKSKRLIDT